MAGRVEELENGVAVYQATDEDADKCNIYCEYPWCPPDSHCFVYMRYVPAYEPNVHEFVACDFETWEKRTVGLGNGGQSMGSDGSFYYRRTSEAGRHEFVRYDLVVGTSEVIELPEGVPDSSVLAVSRDVRYLAYSQVISYDPQRFGVGIADLHTGTCWTIHEDQWLCNPHLQFEPSEGRRLLVQHNRGCVFTAQGERKLLVGEEGCTLFFLDVPGGEVTRLNVGPPYTASVSGHEAWIGGTGEVICTLNYAEDYDFGKGRILRIRPGANPQEICVPWEMNHIGVEPSGRIFAADAYRPDEIIIGSPRRGKAAVVCPSRGSHSRANLRRGGGDHVYDTHPHAYISPDRRWVVYNSDRPGIQQIYAAAIPEGMISDLEGG